MFLKLKICRDNFFRLVTLILATLALVSCGAKEGTRAGTRIGIDPTWYPIDFGSQTAYVNGLAEDVLLEIATAARKDFIRLKTNSDAILHDLDMGKCDAILTSLSPYNFNTAKYDFSKNFLSLGSVLIVPANAKASSLDDLHGELVGTLVNDPAVMLLQDHPEIILRTYPGIPQLLNAVLEGEVEGALLDRIPAANFIRDLYADKLKIATKPLTDLGLHLLVLKGTHSDLVRQFDQFVEKNKNIEPLLKKWQLN
jgi:polar amino acid transport system substrate-binding protein